MPSDGGTQPHLTYSERVKRRYELFWRRRRLTLHTRGICQLTYRTRQDPLPVWHCCDYWQRKLSNKWNSREFAQKLGCPTPELYWSGLRVGEIPFERLPDRYVIRPVVGHSRQGIFVMDRGRNLMDGQAYDPSRLRAAVAPWVRGLPRRRILVEELVPPEPNASALLPRDYKLHVFGSEIGAIQAIERGSELRVWTFDAEWNRLPDIQRVGVHPEVGPPPPHCLDELRRLATTLGTAFGSYVRVDLYASPRGALFGEFAATPAKGLNFTPFADRLLGELWERTFPHAI